MHGRNDDDVVVALLLFIPWASVTVDGHSVMSDVGK
jgi:hypothetical protein